LQNRAKEIKIKSEIKIMKLQTYTSTPGLERYPQQERFAAWRAVHKHLMRNDPPYLKRFFRFISSIFWLTCIFMAATIGVGYLPLGGMGIVLEIFVPTFYVATVVLLSFRQQHFMNQSIGNCLQSSHADPASQNG
jgi:hypothetical protein